MTLPVRDVDEWGRVSLRAAQDALFLLYAGGSITDVGIPDGPEVQQFNKWAQFFDKAERVGPLSAPTNTPSESHEQRRKTWLEPLDETLDLRRYLLSLCVRDDERRRINEEMDLYEQKNATTVLRIAIMLVAYFRETGQLWGVGRGSSVASYALFLIGLHKIDSIRFGLPITEFLR